MNDVFIIAAKRTAIGSFQGAYANTPAPQLGAHAISSALKQAQVDPKDVDECLMGQVLTAGTGQAPARQAALAAQLPHHTHCMTINKVCGSGLKAIMLAVDSIQLKHSQIAVAGGQENMTLSPHLLPNVRSGYRIGHQQVLDSMVHDGLWDPYNDFHMGNAAEICANEYQFSRQEQDDFAIESYKKAQNAESSGYFKDEITAIEIHHRKSSLTVDKDEEPTKVNFEKIPTLRPAFQKEGTITAANASKINDGAAALVLASAKKVQELGLKPMAKVIAHSTFAQEPKWFTTAPIGAVKKVLEKAQMQVSDIDLFEINEAFSNVTMATMKDLSIPHDKVNVHGGAVALGHPIGASGARILTTLLYALKKRDKQRGLATLCIGGGEAVAMIVERV